MLSSDKNINTICQLIEDIKEYCDLKGKIMQINLVRKISKLISILVLGAFLFMFITLACIFTSMMVANAIDMYVQNKVISYAILVCIYVLIALLIYFNRMKWIEHPVTNFISHLFLEPKNNNFEEINEEKDSCE